MNISVASLPHFVVEVENNEYLGLPRYLPLFCQKVANFDFGNPHESLEQACSVEISGNKTTVQLKYFEPSLDAANKRIFDITQPIHTSSCNCSEDVKVLKGKVADNETKIALLEKELNRLRESVNILSVCQSVDPSYAENAFVTIPKLDIKISRAILDRALKDSSMNSGAELILSDLNLWPMEKHMIWSDMPAPLQEKIYEILAFFADKILAKSGETPDMVDVKKLTSKLRLHFQQVMRNNKHFLHRRKRIKVEDGFDSHNSQDSV